MSALAKVSIDRINGFLTKVELLRVSIAANSHLRGFRLSSWTSLPPGKETSNQLPRIVGTKFFQTPLVFVRLRLPGRRAVMGP